MILVLVLNIWVILINIISTIRRTAVAKISKISYSGKFLKTLIEVCTKFLNLMSFCTLTCSNQLNAYYCKVVCLYLNKSKKIEILLVVAQINDELTYLVVSVLELSHEPKVVTYLLARLVYVYIAVQSLCYLLTKLKPQIILLLRIWVE